MRIETQRQTLVRLLDCDTDEFIRAYWTSNGSDALKQFDYAMNHNIEIELETDNGWQTGLIDDIRINFGSDIFVTAINVYAKVI